MLSFLWIELLGTNFSDIRIKLNKKVPIIPVYISQKTYLPPRHSMWFNSVFGTKRFMFHYLWIFLVGIFTHTIYCCVFVLVCVRACVWVCVCCWGTPLGVPQYWIDWTWGKWAIIKGVNFFFINRYVALSGFTNLTVSVSVLCTVLST